MQLPRSVHDNLRFLCVEVDSQVASLQDPRLLRDMQKRIRDVLAGFPGYAKIRRVSLMLEPWSIENGLMTPTLKVKRRKVLEHCSDQVAQLYRGDLA